MTLGAMPCGTNAHRTKPTGMIAHETMAPFSIFYTEPNINEQTEQR